MRRHFRSILAAALALAALASAAPAPSTAGAQPAAAPGPAAAVQPRAEVRKSGLWRAPAGLEQIPIWPHGAPDMPGVAQTPESVLAAQTPEAIGGHISEAIFDVTAPTMTIYPPKGPNRHAAMIVFPGGGFQVLAVTIEGTEICDWITAQGITCIVSKYRVPNGNHHWDADCKCHVTPKIRRALQDAQRTIRLVRSKAAELNVDPARIGVIGFSAGGYLVAQTSNMFEPSYTPVDAVDRVSSRPDFAVALYPGHLCREGGVLEPGIQVTKRTPPTFLLQNWDDPVDEICNSIVYARALDRAGVPAEVHLFAKGGHAFGLRRKDHPVAMWPTLVESWLKEIGIL
jgi:acetyl esterase/lipase